MCLQVFLPQHVLPFPHPRKFQEPLTVEHSSCFYFGMHKIWGSSYPGLPIPKWNFLPTHTSPIKDFFFLHVKKALAPYGPIWVSVFSSKKNWQKHGDYPFPLKVPRSLDPILMQDQSTYWLCCLLFPSQGIVCFLLHREIGLYKAKHTFLPFISRTWPWAGEPWSPYLSDRLPNTFA